MAWNQMEYKCGHTERIQMYGKNSERERSLEYAKNHKLCPDCYQSEKESKRLQENERAATLSSAIGFAELTGSEKQVAWAQSIRQSAYEKMVAEGKEHPVHGWSLMVSIINCETSAKWWIDNRTSPWSILFRQIGANYPAKLAELKDKGATK